MLFKFEIGWKLAGSVEVGRFSGRKSRFFKNRSDLSQFEHGGEGSL